MGQLAVFLVLIVVVVVGVHYYLWRRLVRDTTGPGRGRRIGTFVILGLALLIPVTLVLTRLFSGMAALALIGYLWLAVMFYLLVTLAVLEIPRALLQRRRRDIVHASATTQTPPLPQPVSDDLTRRQAISRGLAITAGLVAVGTTGYGVTQALGAPRLKRQAITLAKLPRSMDGYRIALVSDIHLGPLAGRAHTQRIVDIINGLDADIVTVVGDLVDGSVAELGAAAQPLRDLRSKHGSFFVTGNHEYFSGFEEWIAEVDELGLRPLRNERVELPGGLDLAGVNDVTGAQFDDGADLGKALGDRDTSKAVVLLAHQPVQVRDAAKFGVDLQLSGHTHGGQMVPFNLVVPLQQPVVSGYDVIDGTQIYVTNGAGFWGPPVRVGAPPDITLVQLRSK
ncbi:putative MPP superfamily phosphohydrolase/uncharacterized membrane protein [Allocatelliglobosispora scoriae]|uniref:Putative MPP superfamily phosphohydrolase/uncharacterized membrane protein n=1 Tax=Allocatelliglobosispora scoriae TaxID=643052 RepID=A0A841BPE1_9ACTN|nr:metallophosphoesterase [Allocatelliglobosispora scoriae]MBB5870947.1 putative MPP superfamily phosphohydrolase/uncharacterized membrane protein [Allocatelliglobosispora scoriae]